MSAWNGPAASQPNFESTALFPQVGAQTAGKVVMGFSIGALYAHLGALRARHLILGSVAPFFLEDDDEPERWQISYRAGNPATPAGHPRRSQGRRPDAPPRHRRL